MSEVSASDIAKRIIRIETCDRRHRPGQLSANCAYCDRVLDLAMRHRVVLVGKKNSEPDAVRYVICRDCEGSAAYHLMMPRGGGLF